MRLHCRVILNNIYYFYFNCLMRKYKKLPSFRIDKTETDIDNID